MHPTPRYRRLAILIEGGDDIFRNKTAIGLLRFRPQDVACVVDPSRGGLNTQELGLADSQIPVVANVAEAVRIGIDWLVIGVATPGGYLPQSMRAELYEAIRNRIGIISGLHDTVRDPNLVSMAARYAVELVNIRRTDADLHSIGTAKARTTRGTRILTVGTDASIGKTTTTFLLQRALNRAGHRTGLVATGQDGVLIHGEGLCIDHQIADFCSGAVENMVVNADAGKLAPAYILVEGQNAIFSPCYSASAIALLHGTCPDLMVLCHAPERKTLRNTDVPVPSLKDAVRLYEALVAPIHPGRVIAISLNTNGLDDNEAASALRQAEAETGLLAIDPVRGGDTATNRLVQTLLRHTKTKTGSKLSSKSPRARKPASQTSPRSVKKS